MTDDARSRAASKRTPDERLVDIILITTPIRTPASARGFISLLRERGVRIEVADPSENGSQDDRSERWRTT